MKKTILKSSLMAAFVLLGTLTFVSCSNDSNEEKARKWSDYVRMDVQRCERVGSYLYMEYTMTNITSQPLGVTMHLADVNGGSVFDNLGQQYVVDGTNWDNETLWRPGHSVSLSNIYPQKNRTVRIKVKDFDPSNRATKAGIRFNVDIADVYYLEDDVCQKRDIPVVDHRVLDNGIQSNDLGLDYQLNSCVADDEGNVVIDFTIKNNTGVAITGFYLETMEGFDDRSNYFDESVVSWAVGDSEDFGWRIEDVTIPRDGTLHARVQVANVSPQATTLTLLAQNSARYDVFDPVDPIVRFLNITIER